jgi:CheY-like chemotaxis protein
MNAIQVMAQIAGSIENLSDSHQTIINQGLLSIKLLTSAIEALLDFSNLDSGQFSLETKEFSTRDLIDGISGMAQAEAKEKSLSFSTRIDDAVPEFLLGDPARLQQALFNIVMNAVKFTESGSVEIRIYPEKIEYDDKVPLIFEVHDTGIGMTEEQMADMFKPLYSGDTSYSRKYRGLGLGLSVSSSLIHLMGGKITCKSRLGEGSAFRIEIPLAVPAKKAMGTASAPEKPNLDVLRGLRVLVAEDNNINQIIMEELLTSAGMDVTTADNGAIALEKLNESDFEVVLMDIQMPHMDGLTATAQIRADSRYDKLPILAMTANVGQGHYEECISAGMNDYLTKPIDTSQLYATLIKWCTKEL